MFIRFDRIHERDRRTHLCGKNDEFEMNSERKRTSKVAGDSVRAVKPRMKRNI